MDAMRGTAAWAFFWGAFGGAALLLGAVLGLASAAGRRVIAAIMALGSGVLSSLGFLAAFLLSKLE